MRYASLGLWALALGVSALSVQAAETSQNNAQNTTVATPAAADNSAVQSQDSVVVFGESETANGQQDEFLMEQSSSNENPLGNPIVDSAVSAPTPSAGEMPNNAMNDASASQSTPDVKVAPSNVVQDKPNHVGVWPVGGTMQDWIDAGSNSKWTQAVKSVVLKWKG